MSDLVDQKDTELFFIESITLEVSSWEILAITVSVREIPVITPSVWAF